MAVMRAYAAEETPTEPQGRSLAERATGTAIVTTFHVFHARAYFGSMGRIVLFVSSMTLPLLAVTGMLLCVGRQQRKRENQRKRRGSPA